MTNDPWDYRTVQSRQARVYSQNGEDGVMLYLLSLLRFTPDRCFEIGGGLVNGQLECNTAILLNNGWDGVVVDQKEIVHPLCRQARVTRDTVLDVVRRFNPDPLRPGVISVDVDGVDYWLMDAILSEYKPGIYVAEYNAHKDPRVGVTVPYSDDFEWDGSDYFGASARAMLGLGHKYGYMLAATVSHLNMFFVRHDLVPMRFTEPPLINLGLPTNRHPTDRRRPWQKV